MNPIRWTLLACAAIAIAAAVSGCVQVVQATDCRESAASRCGIITVDTKAMTSVPVTVPVSAVPPLTKSRLG